MSVSAATEQAAAQAIEDAREFERAGRWSEAIDVLTAANGAARADAIENALAALRYRSGAVLASEARTAPLPAPGISPPVGPSGLPETDLAGVDAATLRAALLDHGVLLVRGAVERAVADRWAEAIEHCLEVREEVREGRVRSSWWRPLEVPADLEASLARPWIRAGGGTLLADSPRLLADLVALYDGLGLGQVVADYLGSRAVLSANKCTLRRVSLDVTAGWHQDGAFLGKEVRALNLWLALTDCGVDAPGLDIVPRRLDDIVETGTDGAYFDWDVGSGRVDEVAGSGGVVRPRFDAGDLLLFDERLLHSTAISPEMTRQRYAIESWCFAPSAYPDGHITLVW